MKKINLLLIGGALTSVFMFQSCQQPEADQATIDAKVTEAYNAEKMKVENESATACEDAINAQVKVIQDSLSHLNVKQQADLLAKTQRELKLAQAKADALKKKKANNPAKQVMTEDDRIKKAQEELLKNKGQSNVQKTDAEIIKAQQELLKKKGEANVQKTDDEVKKAQEELLRKLQGK
jgi:hypothetical protein